jgi:predicted RNase H-like nuclease
VRWINHLLFTDFIQKRIQAYKKKQVEAKRQEIRELMKEIKDGGGLYQPGGHSKPQ